MVSNPIRFTRGMVSITSEFSRKGSRMLVDDRINLSISGLNANQEITAYLNLNEGGIKYHSFGHFRANQNGIVMLEEQKPSGGTYDIADSMGLFWSMIPHAGQRKGVRIMKKNIATPFKYNFSIFDCHRSLNDLQKSAWDPLASTIIDRFYLGNEVMRIPVKAGRIRGSIFIPKGRGPFPGVIDMFGTAGGLVEFRSALLASRGFISFALAYFRYDDLPEFLDLDLEYFLEAAEWFAQYNQVVGNKVGVIGVSKGAEIAVLMGIHSPFVEVSVPISGLHYVSEVPITYNKIEMPFYCCDFAKIKMTNDEGFYAPLPDVDASGHFPVEKAKGVFLFLAGTDDPCAGKPPVDALMGRLKKAGKTGSEAYVFTDAGHLIEPPYMPLCRFSYHKLVGDCMQWGGKTLPHAMAQEKAWSVMQKFLRKHLTKSKQISKL